MKRNEPKPRRGGADRSAVSSGAVPGRPRFNIARVVVTLGLLFIGAVAAVILSRQNPFEHPLGPRRWIVVAVAAGVALIPPISRMIVEALVWVRYPSARAKTVMSVTIAVLASAYFLFTALNQGRDLFPKTHDDQSYFLQMRMLAEGRLWMPQHPLADFFDTFYVLCRPKYASLYFPGTALLYVPTIWLGLPTWLMPIGVAGAIVGLLYRITAEFIDGVSGVLAAALLASLSWFRVYSVLLTSHEPALLFGMLLVWSWLRWRRSRHPGWFAAMGVFAGWGAIIRPVDALCFAIPVGLALTREIFRSRRKTGSRTPAGGSLTQVVPSRPRTAALALLLIAGCAAPFLAAQAVFNRGVTGHWLQTPYALYLQQDQPNTAFGFHPLDDKARPQSRLQQKQDYYASFFVPYIKDHQPNTFLAAWRTRYAPMIADVTLPAVPLIVLLPLGLLGLMRRGLHGIGLATGRGIVLATLPLFVGLYMLNTFFLEHYALLVAPAVIILLLSAGRALEAAFLPIRRYIVASFTVGLAALAIVTLPELNNLWDTKTHPQYVIGDETFPSPFLRTVHEMVEKESEPAVVLFRYTKGDPTYEEPVYNTQAAWPDDARVILAHDLGPERNKEIFQYFARRQPERTFYRVNRAAGMADPNKLVEELGDARTLAAQAQ